MFLNRNSRRPSASGRHRPRIWKKTSWNSCQGRCALAYARVDREDAPVVAARSEEREAQATLLDESVHLVQEVRDPLGLVHENPLPSPKFSEPRCEERGIGGEAVVHSLVQEIDPPRLPEAAQGSGALSDPAHAEEEEARTRGVRRGV